MTALLHASCVSDNGRGILLLGDSGAGKSDLALRLIDSGAMLVADDQVVISRHDAGLVASPPDTLRGMLEVRGIGIVHLPYRLQVPLTIAVQLVAREALERLPEPQFFDCLDSHLPLLSLHAFDESACAKIRIFMESRL